jgi:hypothetical protein
MCQDLIPRMCFILALGALMANVAPGGIVIERRVATSADDVEEAISSGAIDMHSSDLEMPYENSGKGNPQIIGLRFQDVGLPKGARIKEAWLQFEVDETKDALPVTLLIEGELNPNPPSFTQDLRSVSGRPRTKANVSWSVPVWGNVSDQGPDQRSTDITPVLEEIISQDDWEAGNALVVIIRDDPDHLSTGVRTAASYSLPTGAPLLHIEIFGTIATKPIPADGARSVTPMLLEWTAGDTAALHEVYFGVNPILGPDDFRGRQPLTLFWLGSTLAPGTTYYWRVDEVDADETTIHTGDVWSFTTTPLTAYDPSPSTGAKWIGTNPELIWSAGLGAVTHDVYFGVDRAAVEQGAAETYQGNVISPRLIPGQLAEDTTYYWRVDEIQADLVTKRTGALWQFTTVGPGGGVKGEYYHYSTSAPPTPPDAAFETLRLTRVDPRIDFEWGGGSPDPLINADSFAARWTGDLETAFSEPYTFSTSTDDGLKLWIDGRLVIDNWTLHGTTVDSSKPIELAAGPGHSLELWWFDNTSDARVQLYWQSPSTPRQIIPQGALSWPLRARSPNPPDSAGDVRQTLVLRWEAGDDAVQHDVYFGEDANAVAAADPGSAQVYGSRQGSDVLAYDVGTLDWNKTYYWRIDEVNDAEANSPWKGRVWSFTTADFVVVDDFEGYTDDMAAGDAIFQTWIDGLENDTGSYVGYATSSGGTFCERQIVHGGSQSMPLAYDNTASPYYSQADRKWETPQDWTVNEVNTLILYFRGRSGNEADRLYATLEDSAGKTATVVYPDLQALLGTSWTEWQIPLGDFAGVDATRIKTLCVGVGDRTDPAPGGKGLIYIDDIRVAKSAIAANE